MPNSNAEPIAIVGMSCIFPGAPNLEYFWHNIVNAVDAVRDPGEQEWDARFYSEKPAGTFGKIYCSKAGFITDYADFDPLEFGIMPASLKGSDPDQYLALRAAAEALKDAGYQHKTFDAERAEIIIGRTMAPGVGSLNLIQHGQTIDQVIEILKAVSPHLSAVEIANIEQRLRAGLQPCSPDTIPAVMPNVLSGRIASKLGFRGRNLVLDAACASSLIAVETAIQGLHSRQSDLAIAGGVHINSSPYFFQMFCELGALSSAGEIRPFDDTADGTVLGEGVGMIVLKRLDDAVKDKNKIYAVIRGVGSSSDGRGGTSLAPSEDGEALAMRRAYQSAGISPATIGLYEAHGTGTRAGDKAEMKAIQEVFLDPALNRTEENQNAEKKNESGKSPSLNMNAETLKPSEPWCALGSVKSMIGHTQAASGIAGLIKAVLSLHHKVLPPTLHTSNPNKQIDWSKSPCFIIGQAKSWDCAPKDNVARLSPRRAAVSAFGFGGVNAHIVLEEFSSNNKIEKNGGPLNTSPPAAASPKSASTVRLLLKYPALRADGLSQLLNETQSVKEPVLSSTQRPSPEANAIRLGAGNKQQASKNLSIANSSSPSGPGVSQEQELVMRAYLQTLGQFQKNILGVQEQVMMSYLSEPQD